ncbi:hypothetical protein LJC36_04355 [Desulfovibrio sp. OttesenSCG-928-C14]|nr:hypothetical protein [Desulfovibrio sp. OttesenSCG-928-C14]
MCVFLGLSGLCPLWPEAARLPYLFVFFTLAGFCGGAFLIPVVSFIQVKPGAHEKGRILGISNFNCFTGIMLSGPLFGLLLEGGFSISWKGVTLFSFTPAWLSGMAPSLLLVLGGAAGFLAVLLLARELARLPEDVPAGPAQGQPEKNPAAPRRPGQKTGAGTPGTLGGMRGGLLGLFMRLVLALRYRVRSVGLDKIPYAGRGKEGLLFLPNHPALIDPVIVIAELAGARPRPLADRGRMSGLWGRLASRFFPAVTIPDLSQRRGRDAVAAVREGMRAVCAQLESGQSVLFYPAGRIYRPCEALEGAKNIGRESIGNNSGLYQILKDCPDARVILVRSSGLWGSSFSIAGAGCNPGFTRTLLRGLLTLLGNGIFFAPRRVVELEFVEREDFPRRADRKALNAWLEDFYNEKSEPPQEVPRFFWQGKKR